MSVLICDREGVLFMRVVVRLLFYFLLVSLILILW